MKKKFTQLENYFVLTKKIKHNKNLILYANIKIIKLLNYAF